MLRIAIVDDVDHVVKMVMKFAENSPFKDYVEEAVVRQIAEDLIETDNSQKIILLHGEEGLLAGQAIPFVFGTKLMATEVWWWVDPDARGKSVGKELLEAFEFWAKKVGCALITMSSLDETIGKYYEK